MDKVLDPQTEPKENAVKNAGAAKGNKAVTKPAAPAAAPADKPTSLADLVKAGHENIERQLADPVFKNATRDHIAIATRLSIKDTVLRGGITGADKVGDLHTYLTKEFNVQGKDPVHSKRH